MDSNIMEEKYEILNRKLAKRKTKEGVTPIHTRFFTWVGENTEDQETGSYSISQRKDKNFKSEFDYYICLSAYYHYPHGFLEMPYSESPFRMDFDLTIPIEEAIETSLSHFGFRKFHKLYKPEDITFIVNVIQNCISFLFKPNPRVNKDFWGCVVLEKKYAKIKKNPQEVTDGFHLHFPYLILNNCDWDVLQNEIVAHLTEQKKNISWLAKKNPEEISGRIIDNMYGKYWLMYGGSKSNIAEPYLVTYYINEKNKSIGFQEFWKNDSHLKKYKTLWAEQGVKDVKDDFYLPILLSLSEIDTSTFCIRNRTTEARKMLAQKSAEKKKKQEEYAMKYEEKRSFEAETQKRMSLEQKEALYEIESQLICLVDGKR